MMSPTPTTAGLMAIVSTAPTPVPLVPALAKVTRRRQLEPTPWEVPPSPKMTPDGNGVMVPS